jgi:ferric-dicitrate binding protein FerR (iron transport regulator)
MSEQPTPSPPRRRRAVLATVLALVALAIAVPASGALAGGGAGSAGSALGGGQQRTAPVQDRSGGRHGDCPGHDGGRSQSRPSDGATASAV